MPNAATGIVTINAPKKGIKTENPTNTDKRAMYCKSKYIKTIDATRQTITISIWKSK